MFLKEEIQWGRRNIWREIGWEFFQIIDRYKSSVQEIPSKKINTEVLENNSILVEIWLELRQSKLPVIFRTKVNILFNFRLC